jgi:hypothetical protein
VAEEEKTYQNVPVDALGFHFLSFLLVDSFLFLKDYLFPGGPLSGLRKLTLSFLPQGELVTEDKQYAHFHYQDISRDQE